MNRVLVIATHPDDEILGIGGTICRHAENGDEIQAIIACEGESLRYGKDVGQSLAIEEAANILGIGKTHHLKYPDQKLDTVPLTSIISNIEEISSKFKPNIVYCQSGCDINRDHKIIFEATLVALRPLAPWLESFYCFYTASSTEWGYPRSFEPDTWVNIDKYIDKKIEAFKRYKSEVRDYPHPRSPESLRYQAHFWGNQCCMDNAESLMTIRKIIK